MIYKFFMRSILVGGNILIVLGLLYSLMLFTSLYKWAPWYEPCGMQFVAVYYILIPLFLILGICLFILRIFIRVSLLSLCIPFLAIGGMYLPFRLSGGANNKSLLIANIMFIILLVLSIVNSARDFMSGHK